MSFITFYGWRVPVFSPMEIIQNLCHFWRQHHLRPVQSWPSPRSDGRPFFFSHAGAAEPGTIQLGHSEGHWFFKERARLLHTGPGAPQTILLPEGRSSWRPLWLVGSSRRGVGVSSHGSTLSPRHSSLTCSLHGGLRSLQLHLNLHNLSAYWLLQPAPGFQLCVSRWLPSPVNTRGSHTNLHLPCSTTPSCPQRSTLICSSSHACF